MMRTSHIPVAAAYWILAAAVIAAELALVPAAAAGETAFPDFFRRGDANCDLRFGAADVIAPLGRTTGCDNGDCNRNGTVDGADALCGVSCLFGECPVLPGAPQISEVVPESAAEVVPLSSIRIRGHDLAPLELVSGGAAGVAEDGGLLQVRINGQEAGILEATPEELVVLVPPMNPGAVDLVVLNGEKSSHLRSLTIAESTPRGEPDGLADVLDIFDEAAARFSALDLSAVYDEESAEVLRGFTSAARDQISSLRTEALEPLPEEIRDLLDGLLDAGGMVDEMRARLAELDQIAGDAGAAGPAPAAVIEFTKRVVTQIYVATAQITRIQPAAKAELLLKIGAATRRAESLRKLLTLAQKGLSSSIFLTGLAALYEVLPQAFRDATMPIPIGFEFRDRTGAEREYPMAGGTMRIRGCRIGESATSLSLKLSGVDGSVPLEPTGSCDDTEGLDLCPPHPIPPFENGCLEYRLPDTVGFCGLVGFSLANIVGPRLEVRAKVQPDLVAAEVRYPGVLNSVQLQVHGVAPCEAEVFAEGPDPSTTVWQIGLPGPDGVQVIRAPGQFVKARANTRKIVTGGCEFAEISGGNYRPSVAVDEVRSEELFSIDVDNGMRMTVDCEDSLLSISQENPPAVTKCSFRPAGIGIDGRPAPKMCFPAETNDLEPRIEPAPGSPTLGDAFRVATSPRLQLVRSDSGMDREAFTVFVQGIRPGKSLLKGAAFLDGGIPIVETESGFEIEVRDLTGPSLEVDSCGGTVAPGDEITVHAFAVDNFLMSRLGASAPASVTANPMQEFPCILDVGEDICPPIVECDTCATDFRIQVLEDAPDGPFDVEIEAVDGAGASNTKTCRFSVSRVDETPPKLFVSPCGGTVKAGTSLRIDVEATDNKNLKSLRASVPNGVSTNPSQTMQCNSDACVASFTFAIPTNAPRGAFNLEIEAVDADDNSAAEQCAFDTLDPDPDLPELTVEPCGGIAQPGQTIRFRVEARDDRALARLVIAAGEVAVEPTQEIACNSLRSCNRNVEIRLQDAFGADSFDVRIEAVDGDDNRGAVVCRYQTIRPPRVTLRKILDTTTPVPGVEEAPPFQNLSDWVLAGGKVAFSASYSVRFTGFSGIFVWGGDEIVTVADSGTVVPDTEGPRHFRGYGEVAVDGDEVLFRETGFAPSQNGDLYRMRIGGDRVNGAERVVDFPDDDAPNYTFFYRDGLVAGWLSPFGGVQDPRIYFGDIPTSGAALERVVDTSDDIPMGSGKFSGIGSPGAVDADLQGLTFAFRGFGEQEPRDGIYTVRPGAPILPVAQKLDPMPGMDRFFASFCGESIDGTRVAFQGAANSVQQGIYSNRGGTLEKMADIFTIVPGGDDPFEKFSCTTGLDDGIVWFRSVDPIEGIFANVGGAITRIVAVGDQLNGGIVQAAVGIIDDRVERNHAVIYVSVKRPDNSFVGGLFLATVEVQSN